jgi:hypothetical protein
MNPTQTDEALKLAQQIDANFSQVMMDSEGTISAGDTETLAWAVIDLSAQLADAQKLLDELAYLTPAQYISVWNGDKSQSTGYFVKVEDLEELVKQACALLEATRQPTQDKGGE